MKKASLIERAGESDVLVLKTFIATAMILCAMSAFAQGKNHDETSVKSFVEEYTQALNDRNEEKLVSMYAYPQQAAISLSYTIEQLKLMDEQMVRSIAQIDVIKVDINGDIAVADIIVNTGYSGDDSQTVTMFQLLSKPVSMQLTLMRSGNTWKMLKEDTLE